MAHQGYNTFHDYMSHKINKLNEQNQHDPEGDTTSVGNGKQQCFVGCEIFVNGVTNPPLQDIRKLVLDHGGKFNSYQVDTTTHVVCNHYSTAQLALMLKAKSRSKIIRVTDRWVVKCIELGRCIMDVTLFLPVGVKQNWGIQDKFRDSGTMRQLSTSSDSITVAAVPLDCGSDPWPGDMEGECGDPELDVDPAGGADGGVVDGPNGDFYAEADPVEDQNSSATRSDRRALTSDSDPARFLHEYFGHSRLHFIGKWKSSLPLLIAQIQETNKEMLSASTAPTNGAAVSTMSTLAADRRLVMHVDMDCFFVSVAMRRHPELAGAPVVVAHSSRNVTVKPAAGPQPASSFGGFSEISSCSYAARALGVRNGMLMKTALAMVKAENDRGRMAAENTGDLFIDVDLVVLPYDFAQYSVVSKQVYRLLYTMFLPCATARTAWASSNDGVPLPTVLCIQPVSIDEVYMEFALPCVDGEEGDIFADVGTDGIYRNLGVAKAGLATLSAGLRIAQYIRDRIFQATACPSSVGVGRNMLLARLATQRAKPNGKFEITTENMNAFLAPMLLSKIPQVGYALSRQLSDASYLTCADVWSSDRGKLDALLGPSNALLIWNASYGQDDRALVPIAPRKSLGVEINWGIRFSRMENAEGFWLHLCREMESRMEEVRVKCYTVTVKLRRRSAGASINPSKYLGCGRCDCFSKSTSSKVAMGSAGQLQPHCLRLFRELCAQYKIIVEDIRGVGVQLSRLQSYSGSADAQLASSSAQVQRTISFAVSSPLPQQAQSPACAATDIAECEFTLSQKSFIQSLDQAAGGLDAFSGKRLVEDAIAQIVQYNKDMVAGSNSSSSTGSSSSGNLVHPPTHDPAKRPAGNEAVVRSARTRKKAKGIGGAGGAPGALVSGNSKPKMTVDIGFKIQGVPQTVRGELNLRDMLSHFEAEKEKEKDWVALPTGLREYPGQEMRSAPILLEAHECSPPTYDVDGSCSSPGSVLKEIRMFPQVMEAFTNNPFQFLADNRGVVSISQYLVLLSHASSQIGFANGYAWTLASIGVIQRSCFDYLICLDESEGLQEDKEITVLLLAYGLFRLESVGGISTDICVYIRTLRAVRDRFSESGRVNNVFKSILENVEVKLLQQFTMIYGASLHLGDDIR